MNLIENLWAIVEARLHHKNYTSLEQMKLALLKIWNRIQVSLCERLCNSFDKRIEQIHRTGKRYVRVATKKKSEMEKKYVLSNAWNRTDEIERIVYNPKIY